MFKIYANQRDDISIKHLGKGQQFAILRKKKPSNQLFNHALQSRLQFHITGKE